MIDVRCPRCNAGKAALHRVDRYLEAGDHLQEIVCRICGEILASRVVQTARYPSAPEAPGLRKRADVIPAAAAVKKMRKTRASTLEKRRKPCGVPGCPGTYVDMNSKHGICPDHRKKLSSWQGRHRSGGSNARPPITRVNGVWIERGAPLPGVPGELPAPAVRAEKPKGVGKRSPWVGTCGHCRSRRVAIAAWGLCPDCHDAYLRGAIRI